MTRVARTRQRGFSRQPFETYSASILRMLKAVAFARALLQLPLRVLRNEWRRSALLADGLEISKTAVLDVDSGCSVTFGEDCTVGSGTMLFAKNAGGEASHIVLGTHTSINECNNIRAAGGDIRIGSHCQIAQFCTLVSSNHTIDTSEFIIDAPLDLTRRSIVIEDDVWLGANTVVLPGVTIGRGSVVGAGAVVTKNIPPYSVCVGNPARVIRERSMHAA